MRAKWIIVGTVVALLLLSRQVFTAKSGVVLSNLAAMEHARRIVARVWVQYGYQLVVTSGYEGQHSADSLHYRGLAEDYRTRDIASSMLPRMVDDVKALLGRDYDVVLESTHLHVEYDPKVPV